MTRPGLPDSQRRVAISVSLSPRAVAMLDEFIANGHASTRSAAAEYAIRMAVSRALEVLPKQTTRAALQPRLDKRRENQAKPRGGK